MFTGIITAIGTVERLDTDRGDRRIFIRTGDDMTHVPLGVSIACSGVCLTMVARDHHQFAVDVSAETMSKTTLGQWVSGARVNLERALCVGDELGGHLVSGHVDGKAVLEHIEIEGDSHILTFLAPRHLMRFIAPKGSVTLDGVSLTVNEVGESGFTVNIIPHTWIHTTLGGCQRGDEVNLEIDMLARYVARLLDVPKLEISV
ncbi:MAG: riboflavin synthase [Alphaproteobacteria bacterium]|nr:riboflavin synthase [Alphaproteobacteria bacterium]